METVALIRKACSQSKLYVAEWIITASEKLDESIYEVYSQAIDANDTTIMRIIETRYSITPQNVPNLLSGFRTAVLSKKYAAALQILHGNASSSYGKFSLEDVPDFITMFREALRQEMQSTELKNLVKIAYYLKITHVDAPEIIDCFRTACYRVEREWALVASKMMSFNLISKMTATDILHQSLRDKNRLNMHYWLFDFNIARADIREPLNMFRDAVAMKDASLISCIGRAAGIQRQEVEDLVEELCGIMCKGMPSDIVWLVKAFKLSKENFKKGLREMGASEMVLEWAEQTSLL